MPLKKLKAFFKDYEFTDEPVRIDEATVIVNQKKFVESMISILDAHTGNKTFMPYYRHLVRFYHKIKKDESKDNQDNNNQKS